MKRLRLTWDAACQTAVGAPDRYPGLRPRDAIRGSGLRLLPAQVDLVDLDLDLVGAGGEGLQGTRWLTLCFREPLWIEHLLRELPLGLETRGEAEGLGACPGDRGPAAARSGAARAPRRRLWRLLPLRPGRSRRSGTALWWAECGMRGCGSAPYQIHP